MAKEQSNEQHSTSNISYLTQIPQLEPSHKNPGISQPKAEYARNKELPHFFGQPMLRGTYHPINSVQQDVAKPCLFYSHPHGEIWIGDVVDWMSTISSESVDLIFADPPYNIKKAEWDTFESQQEYVNWSLRWIEQAARVLGTTAVVAEQLKRNWQGCDISVEYAGWATKRIELVEDWPLEKWLQYDIDNARRRKH